MEITVGENNSLELRKVFNSIVLVTAEGEKLAVCMRDGGFEISVKDTSQKVPGKEEYYNHYTAKGGVIIPIHQLAQSDDQEDHGRDL